MKSKVENNVNKIEIKEKTLRTQFLSIFLICDLREEKTYKAQNFLNLKFKNRYMKIDTLLSAPKAMIPNDANSFCGQPKNPGTQWNKKD